MADSSEPRNEANSRGLPEGDGDLSPETTFDLLSDRRRRTVVAFLLIHKRSLTVSDLAKLIAEREHETEITELSGDEVRAIHTDLYHVHVPRLADAGVVEYDEKRDLVEPTELLRRLEPHVWPPEESNSRST